MSKNELEKLHAQYRKFQHILLFLDFDGTLVPLQKAHQKSTLSEDRKNLLSRVAREKKFRVILISGRPVEFLKSRLELRNIYYVGNHGLEISGPQFKFQTANQSDWKKKIAKLTEDLTRMVKNHPGVTLEPKGLSVTLHYRGLSAARVDLFRESIKRLDETLPSSLKMTSGKKVYEFRPNTKDDKGTAVKRILRRFKRAKVIPIYTGDDLTDEAGFKAVNPKGYSIRVGFKKNSQARYYLKNHKEVCFFLRFLTIDDNL